MISTETEVIIKILPQRKVQTQMASLVNYIKYIKMNQSKLFLKTEKEGILLNSFCKDSITLHTKLAQGKKKPTKISLINVDIKILNKN